MENKSHLNLTTIDNGAPEPGRLEKPLVPEAVAFRPIMFLILKSPSINHDDILRPNINCVFCRKPTIVLKLVKLGTCSDVKGFILHT